MPSLPSQPRPAASARSSRRRFSTPPHIRLALMASLLASMVLAASTAISSPTASAATPHLVSFHDPVYGFTLSYPATWTLVPERDGSHITLVNQATLSEISPLITTQTGTVSEGLASTVPSDALNVHTRMVAGERAMEYLVPFMPGSLGDRAHGFRPRLQNHAVAVAAPNNAGSITVYTLLLTQGTDAAGNVSPAVSADADALETVVTSLQLPAIISPARISTKQSSQIGPQLFINPGGGGCNAVCWADANWNYNLYDDSANGRDCDPGTGACVYEQTVAGGVQGRSQPDFQCAEFVSRALSQSGQIAGLGNGGVGGYTPVSSNSGGFSYGNYSFVTTPYSSDNYYLLVNVGSNDGTFHQGLYHYLTNAGQGTIQQTTAGAAPGDVVFFYNSTTQSDSTRVHVMIVTSAGGTNATTLLDGHNADLYHQSVQTELQFFASYQVIHLHALSGDEAPATRSGSGWNSQTDGWGQTSYWAYTTTAGSATAWAQLGYSGNTVRCAVAVYVPFGGGTANITYSVQMSNGTWAYRTANQNNFEGWALLFKWGELSSPPVLISVGNNNGTSTQQLGIGDMAYLC